MPTRHGMRRLKLHGTRRKPLGEIMEGEYLRTYRQMRQRIEVYAHAETPESGGESVLRDGERCDELGGIETRTVLTRVGRMDMVGKMEGELWKKHWEKHPPPPPLLLEEEVEWRLSLPSEGKGAQNLHGKPVAGSHQKPTPPKFSTAACARFSDHSPFAEGFSQVETPVLAL